MNEKKKLRILDVGSGKSTALKVFKDIIDQGYEYELVRVDINPSNEPDVVHDIRKPFPPELLGQFDLVLASHVLEHIERSIVTTTVKNIAETLAYMGELWIVVPSMEWCAEQIMAGNYEVAIWQCIYGGGEPNMPNYYYHHQGYVLPMLRILLVGAGLVERRAFQQPFSINFPKADGTIYTTHALQDIVVGARMKPPVEIIE